MFIFSFFELNFFEITLFLFYLVDIEHFNNIIYLLITIFNKQLSLIAYFEIKRDINLRVIWNIKGLVWIFSEERNMYHENLRSFGIFQVRFERFQSFLSQFSYFNSHSFKVFFSFFIELFFNELLTRFAGRKTNEEESKLSILEEFKLSFLAILVHSVSHNIEVNGLLDYKFFFFLVVSVRMYNWHQNR